MNDETCTVKGELHFVWPHSFEDGNTVKCFRCRYFVPDKKNRSIYPQLWTGKCHSNAHQTERGHTHCLSGYDRTISNNSCRWWFPIEKQEGENETFID